MESKQQEYTVKILGQLQHLFEEASENHIDIKELEDNNNASDFFHALANLAPAVVYNKLTKNNAGSLDFNQIANRLCFQNAHLPVDKSEEEKAKSL
ncbi:hypothetical protein [Flavobacterium litorale]|uniref:EF-hand domain-containing protein n=1 Tax=Flavobacterium litorale TaxID=2856519 RepID=A0ABX8V7W1_9FLAO|nr:hypothetical protein [Flavobacterium litorale]QYJ68911.1 hypothetical protein K1I41_03235 [Flavobacterium litorale]